MTKTTVDGDASKYTLWWVSNDRWARMYMGDYDSKEEAEAVISGAVRVFIKYRGKDPKAFGFWSIEKPEVDDLGLLA